jgi:hypothetical protein
MVRPFLVALAWAIRTDPCVAERRQRAAVRPNILDLESRLAP